MDKETNINTTQENAKKPKKNYGGLISVIISIIILFTIGYIGLSSFKPHEINRDSFDAEKISQTEDRMHLDLPDNAQLTRFISWIGWDGGGYMILGMRYDGKPDDFIANNFKSSEYTDPHKYEPQDKEFQSCVNDIMDSTNRNDVHHEYFISDFDMIYTCKLERTDEHNSGRYIIGFKEENGCTAVKVIFDCFDA